MVADEVEHESTFELTCEYPSEMPSDPETDTEYVWIAPVSIPPTTDNVITKTAFWNMAGNYSCKIRLNNFESEASDQVTMRGEYTE